MANQIPEDKEKEYSAQIKQFMESPAWREYALPLIYQVLEKQLPAPVEKGWEEKYRYAFALSSAFSMVINSLTNLSNRKAFLEKMKKFVDEEAKGVQVNHANPVDAA